MKRIVYSVLLLATVVSGGLAQKNKALTEWQKLGATPLDARLETIGTFTSEHKRALIVAIKFAGMPEGMRVQYDDLLLHLGDAETLRKEGRLALRENDHEYSRAISLLKTSRDLQAIEQIAPVLFHTGDEEGPSDLPRAAVAVMAIEEVVAHTSGLRPEVYDWFKAIAPALLYHRIEVMRKWWVANREHFRKQDFRAVQAGEVPPASGDSVEAAALPEASPLPKPSQ